MKHSLIPTIFWSQFGVFVFILCQFFVPTFRDLLRGSTLFLGPFIVFFLLGLVLLILTLKEKVAGKLKKFLLLVGAAATGFFTFVVLHNAFYALNVVSGHIVVLKYLTGGLHAIFFLLAVIACPVGFLVGVIGTIALFVKKGR